MSVKVNSWNAQPDKTREEGLFHVGVLLEGHVLDDRRKLVVIPYHDPSLQPVVSVTWVLMVNIILYDDTEQVLEIDWLRVVTCKSRGMNVSISKICADSSIRILSY